MNSNLYDNYVQILKDELLLAMGCTEPVSVAYAAALARQALGVVPEHVVIEVSRNIIKNVKSVVVPNTGGMRGLQAAAAVGIIAGDAQAELEVISKVTPEQIQKTTEYMSQADLTVKPSESGLIFDICITVFAANDSACARIVDYHTNVVTVRKNEEYRINKEIIGKKESSMADQSLLTVKDICEFAQKVCIDDVKEILDRQISCNMAIAKEGLAKAYGANIGKVLLNTYGNSDIKIKAKAFAAAGSDARMNGCELPVVINSGSGNQGITASVPVIVYAQEMKVSDEELYRALVVSNLTTLHIKRRIGRLSAYCGAVGAGCGAGAGIAYLHGGRYEEISHTLVNGLAIISGTICDGAKASCAAKIASAVDAGILGYLMYREGQEFMDGDGIVKKGVENTIRNIGLLASEGMKETDKEIIKLMIE